MNLINIIDLEDFNLYDERRYAMNELYRHGIKDQKWGVRRWQNADGSLTPEGYPHYGYNGPRKAASAIATTGRN